ncbi:MAG: phenylalanine--tRNA ligase subunit beta [Dysgonamonadaceae bacterium]|jgi:phenylalanyl-tRNA synthetase beta chain|nr:phenylalanine--tRNA ligase subunit beta [Dysgonamonadaceae bacterium]
MNISYNWLKDYVTTSYTPEEVVDALTAIGLETGGVEEIETVKGGLKGLVVGKVLTCEAHPDSDHLHITTVDVGGEAPLSIVCGAPNVAAGQKVIVALIGSVLYSGDESFTIKKSKIRGLVSEGMICAEDEIGLGTSHDGIIVLPKDAQIGLPAKDYYNIQSEYVLEVDITPNRIDAASHFGVARDLYAYLKQNGQSAHLSAPSVDAFRIDRKDGGIPVRVENTEACPRYSGLTIRGVQVKDSPKWLQDRLKLIGLRPINNVVDATNYVMHELGQPLHAFDLNRIKGGEVIIKTLPEGTEFVTLEGVVRHLDSRDLMICNAESGMCIAGVFGGLDSGVTEQTTDVFLESAYFHPTWIRKSAKRHGLNTDASFRYERGCDPNNTVYILKRAAMLIRELAGGECCGEIQDIYPQPVENAQITVSYRRINSLIGKEIPKDTIRNILNSLEIDLLSETDEELSLSIPTYRVDVKKDVDVIEDILRIYGYNRIETGDSLKSSLSFQTATDRSYRLQELIADQLSGAGFNEILNNSFSASAYYENLQTYPASHSVKVENALSAELNVMRQTLLFGGLESVAYNRNRKNTDLKLYEFGNCYTWDESKQKEDNPLAGYSESLHLGLWITGNKISNSWIHAEENASIYELKAYVESILSRLGINRKKLVFGQYEDDVYTAGLSVHTISGRKLGVLGIVDRKIRKIFDIDVAVYVAELYWQQLQKEIKKHQVTYSEISKFPAVKRDLALLLNQAVPFSEIEKVAFDTDKKLLKDVSLFDVYEGRNLPEGKKSYAVSFILQDPEKTLTDPQIDAIMNRIRDNLIQKLEAQLR